ncbi:Fe2+-dependent dioxygenase [Sphingobium sp. PAMC28499]|uniref:Fe2+-dependent dioxygenase n=1 Tax=Sphingobium sp. PAMC28499 TaxID=2565554 RepID=UPI00109D9E86|nr:Fe2+-dependent dioxygenase [Sphingobium sp. PAMC28499]QCB36692.1 Fe2+-dependent dioxygenase [Sphingobium sp. PAMC28499]
MMLSIPGLLSAEDLLAVREKLARADWEDGRSTAGHLAVKVKANLQLPLAAETARALGDLVLDRLGTCPTFIAAALPLRVLPPRFNRYEGGGTYGSHIDNALFRMPNNGPYVRSDISCTLFLSGPEEYDGGELTIEDSYGTQRVKLAAGDMILYPGTSHHRVEPVTRGVRLAAFFWTQSLVPCQLNRRTLFEMDEAIQRLAADHPDHDSVGMLTGVYHNLLRQWSVT